MISPNTYNDEKSADFLTLIESTHKVLMGWKEDESLGKIFKQTVKVNDLVLIAQGSNKTKKAYFCGLVASESITSRLENDGVIFEGQNRLLKYFIKIDEDLSKFDFSDCAYKEASRIPAIYKLKPNENRCDKRLIEILERKLMIVKIKEKVDLLVNRQQIILQGATGAGKTKLAKQMANFLINGDMEPNIENIKDQVKFIQFNLSHNYKNSKSITHQTQDKILAQMAKKAFEDEEKKPYILILENCDEMLESIYETDGEKEITLPSNLYIIGTMNTADENTNIDYTIRRRFTFVDILADEIVVNSH